MGGFKCFRQDKWIDVDPLDLQVGDEFQQAGMSLRVSKKPYLAKGVVNIPAERVQEGGITVVLSDGVIERCMDFTGGDLRHFEDGTAIIANFEAGPGHVYSPRLPRPDLEAFCTMHFGIYESFYRDNRDDLDEGNAVPMSCWWEQSELASQSTAKLH